MIINKLICLFIHWLSKDKKKYLGIMRNLLTITLLFLSVSLAAQDEGPKSLDQQFDQMIEETETFKSYKVIPIERLRNFWSVVNDSIEDKDNQIVAAQEKINEQQDNIASLEDRITEGQGLVDQAEYDRTHITVLGIDFLKSTFILTSFIIIVLLLAMIAYGYGKYKFSNRLATDKTKKYEDLESEFKDYQDSSREKQMKLKRDLQTQINKIEELKHKNISLK